MPKVCVVSKLYFKIIFREAYCLLPKNVIMMFHITTKYRITFYHHKLRLLKHCMSYNCGYNGQYVYCMYLQQ